MAIVELSFPVRGTSLPVDNGFIVYQAVARSVPWVGEQAQVGLAIVPIQGNPHRGFLDLTSGSRLTFRLSAGDVPRLSPLAGQCLVFGNVTLILGQPAQSDLRPSSSLASAFVVAEGCRHSDEVQEWLTRQFRTLDIGTAPELRLKRFKEQPATAQSGTSCPYVRRFQQVGESSVVGWEVQVRGLVPQESLRLQEVGVGPGRRYGCGVFVPDTGAHVRSAPQRRDTGVWFPDA